MNSTLLIALICIVVFIAFVIIIIFIRKNNKKRFNKLQENLDKYNKANKQSELDKKITLSSYNKEENTINNEASELQNEKQFNPIIEDYEEYQPNQTNVINKNINTNTQFVHKNNNLQNNQNPIYNNQDFDVSKKSKSTDDFEKFLDEHAYSRKIIGNDIRKKLNNLPPQVKALILSNVFNKYDDDDNK